MSQIRLFAAPVQYIQVLSDPSNHYEIELEVSIVNDNKDEWQEHDLGTIILYPGKTAIFEVNKQDLIRLGASDFTHIKFTRINYTDSSIDFNYSVSVCLLKFSAT